MATNLELPPSEDLGLPAGWFSSSDVAMYRRLIEGIPDRSIIVEIGVWQGRSLCSIAEQVLSKGLSVYAVDTFEGTPGVSVVHDCGGGLQEAFERNISDFGLRKSVIVLRGHSSLIAKEFRKEAALVFIDGDHGREGVASDVRSWWPHIPGGGTLCGHDYPVVGDTVRGVLKSLSGRMQNDTRSEIWWAHKPHL
jgi:hypothetical protein